jgi:hypothetical protein
VQENVGRVKAKISIFPKKANANVKKLLRSTGNAALQPLKKCGKRRVAAPKRAKFS